MSATTVIGFVDLGEVKNCEAHATLPKGWSAGGHAESGSWHECQLILVDDNDFENQNIRIETQHAAVHVLHNGSFAKWPAQEKWLKEQNWSSFRIDRFSHPGKHFFWEHASSLLKASSQVDRNRWLEQITERYQVVDQFRKLDTFAGLISLYKTLAPNDEIVKDACEIAFEDLRGIGEFGSGNDPLEVILSKADVEVWRLLSRLG